MAARMGSKFGAFRYNFEEKREKLLPTNKGHSEISFFPDDDREAVESSRCCSFRKISDGFVSWYHALQEISYKAWKMGKSDPRKIVFSAKMGLALMLISLLIFLKEPFKDLSQHYVWALLTVVVVFEFSIGSLNIFCYYLLFLLCSLS